VTTTAVAVTTAILFLVWGISGLSSLAGGAPSTRAPNAPDVSWPARRTTEPALACCWPCTPWECS